MITVINVYTVDPAYQQPLIGILTEATETSVVRVPGFVSAILHRGSDGSKVAMYAQWRTLAYYQSMRGDPFVR
jgi:hypothetical protein